MFLKTLEGVCNLALITGVGFYFIPSLFFVWYGPLLVSFLGAIYIFWCHYKQSKNFQQQLQYAPSGEYDTKIKEIIKKCGVSPDNIKIRYAYTAGQIALINGNVLVIDPVLCSIADGDASSDAVKEIYRLHIAPTLTEQIKHGFSKRRELLSLDIQEFLIKHEVGHFVDHFSFKSLALTFLVGFCLFYSGIVAAQLLLSYNVYIAILAGILTSTIVDIALQLFVVNYFFRYFSEKRADAFAVQHSSVDDAKATAIFFEKLQDITNSYNDYSFILKSLPQEVVSGHPTGAKRADHIRNLIS